MPLSDSTIVEIPRREILGCRIANTQAKRDDPGGRLVGVIDSNDIFAPRATAECN